MIELQRISREKQQKIVWENSQEIQYICQISWENSQTI